MEPRDLSAHIPYRAGRGVDEVARELGLDPDDLVKLSSNENPFGPSPEAVAAIQEAADTINTYPKAVHTDLVDRLAGEWDLAPEQVWLGAGGDGVLDYVARTFLSGDRVLVPDPGFAYYPMSARYHGGTVDQYSLRKAADFEQSVANVLDRYEGHRIVYLTSPHNPTGSEIGIEDVRELARETDEETLILVDEAYNEFSDRPSVRPLLDEREDLAILRTFSKTYGLAGVRLGYGLVPEAWADAYDRVNTPFAANVLACHAGLAALDDDEHLERTIRTARWAREYMHDHLEVRTWESGGNFVLAEVGEADAVVEAAKREGVIVRDCTSFGLPECVRITCGTRETTRRAVETLNGVLDG